MTGEPATAVGRAAHAASADWSPVQGNPELEAAWDRRVRSVACATLFAGPQFQTAIRAAFAPSGATEAITLWDGSDLVGLLPLSDLPLGRGALVLRELGFARNAHTLRNHLLVEPDRTMIWALLSAWRQRSGSDSLLLENMPASDGLPGLLSDVARDMGLGADLPTPGRRLDHAELASSYDAYLATRSGQMRRQLRAKRRELESAGRLAIEPLSGHAISGALADWQAVAGASWQGTESGAANTGADWALHAALAGIGILWLARLDGRPIAALRMLEDARAAYVHTMHFDQAFRHLSPGVVLFDAMMRDGCERGLPRVDFNGRNDFFERWATGTTGHMSVRIYRRSLRGRIARAVRRRRRAVLGSG